MTMGMNKNHRPLAQRGYQPMSRRRAWIIAGCVVALYAIGIAAGIYSSSH